VVLLVALLLGWLLSSGPDDPLHPPEPEPGPSPSVVTSTAAPAVEAPPEPGVDGRCAVSVRINAAGCEDGVELTLAARDGSWEDGVFLPCEGAPLARTWTGLSCEGLVQATVHAEGFADVQRTTALDPPFTTIELSLSRARVLRIQALDHRDGMPIEDSWGRWLGQELTTGRVDATTWQGRKGIIELPVPLGLPLLVGASGFAPRTWDGWKGMGPDEYEVLELEPVELFYVRCTLDGEPCPAEDPELQVFSVWHRGLGAHQQEVCEPWTVEGDYLCRGVREGLEAQARLERVVSGAVENSLPAVFGWDGQQVLGEAVLDFPLVDPVPLELQGAGQEERGTPFCVIVPSVGAGRCVAVVPSAVAGYGPSTLQLSSGETIEWAADLMGEGILVCDDGWAAVARGMSSCAELELAPWGAVCVDAARFNRCSLTGDDPPVLYDIEGCHGAVRPGRWTAHCRDESEGRLRFLDCGEIVVTGGETAEIACPG
jgi:hypothetical protein